MNLNIYSEYEVTITSKGATKTYEGYEEFNSTNSYHIDGGKLMEWIAKDLLDKDISSIEIGDNTIRIATFNPMSGEGGEYIYKIEGA